MERVDVAVVGGGPAGISAAKEAAAHGAKTVCFEQGVPREDRDGLGPDSTDAAGFLDYWVEIMDIPHDEIPEDIIHQQLDAIDFIGPNEGIEITATGIESSYPRLGYTFHRARMDDWLRECAEDAGVDYRLGTGVRSLESDLSGTGDWRQRHTLGLSNGETVEAEYVVLADGPQRRVTLQALDQFMPPDRSVSEVLSPPKANHIAYQEYREFPEELFEPHRLKFWWGYMPGETAYPWVFPNDGTVARVGLTMPIGMDLSDVRQPEAYKLLRPTDTQIPTGQEYISRLLEELYGENYDIETDIPRVETRGKSKGTETYPISSTRPIESPTRAGIAVAGGAMGTTSAFHEGGYHLAVRTGKIAGRLAATHGLESYNDLWKRAVGDELLRNVVFADMVADHEPQDWDRAFRTINEMNTNTGGSKLVRRKYSAGIGAAKIAFGYKKRKWEYRNGGYVQLREAEYAL